MPDCNTFLLFVAASLILSVTPGPDMLLIASRSVSQGRMAGLMTWCGIAAGCYCHVLAAAFGLSAIIVRVPLLYDAIRWAGCAYLLYLAIGVARAQAQTFEPSADLGRISVHRLFFAGLATNILNPKIMLFVLALFPQFVRPEAGSIAVQMLVLVTIFNLLGLVVNGVVIVLSGQFHRRLTGSGRFGKLPQYALAMVYAGLACRVAFGSRQ